MMSCEGCKEKLGRRYLEACGVVDAAQTAGLVVEKIGMWEGLGPMGMICADFGWEVGD